MPENRIFRIGTVNPSRLTPALLAATLVVGAALCFMQTGCRDKTDPENRNYSRARQQAGRKGSGRQQSLYDKVASARTPEDAAAIQEMIQGGMDPDGDPKVRATTPLFEAANRGKLDVIRVLVVNGADVDKASDHPAVGLRGPLHVAASGGNTQIAEFLLSKGASVDKKDVNGVTPLIDAARSGNPAIIELLLKAGADVNAATPDGVTALHRAITNDADIATTEVLIKAGANIEARNSHGMTPLNAAAAQGQIRQVEYLIEAGADINATNTYGRTPLAEAFGLRQWKVADLLRKYGAE